MKFRTNKDPIEKMKPCVGSNGVPEAEGVVRVGDLVYITKMLGETARMPGDEGVKKLDAPDDDLVADLDRQAAEDAAKAAEVEKVVVKPAEPKPEPVPVPTVTAKVEWNED